MIRVLRCWVPVKAQFGKCAKFHARGKGTPEKTGGSFKSCENLCRSGASLQSGDIYIGKGQFPIKLNVRHKDLFQARVIDLVDEHLRELLFDAVCNAL